MTDLQTLNEVPPTRGAALARIAGVRSADYARTRNHLEGAVTGLSPYITHGLVTLRDVLAGVLQHERLEIQHKLVFELGWREFFRHRWLHLGDGILESLHSGPRRDCDYTRVLSADIREARTGVPVIDECVRTLYSNGTIHNHARMWLASYVVHLRHVHWRAGADWLVAHLLDGDLASNHLSWQWVAGTGSHKPYLFNAENVARFAPERWHSPGTVIDQPYEALDRIARGESPQVLAPCDAANSKGIEEPSLLTAPPADLELREPDPGVVDRLRGREVWLVHPWALRAPPDTKDAVVIGVYFREQHAAWPWPAARWQWVDAAMATIARERWLVDADTLAMAVSSAARVRCVDDPHLTRMLPLTARCDPAPTLFPSVQQPCTSFSQWWSRATRGLKYAEELL